MVSCIQDICSHCVDPTFKATIYLQSEKAYVSLCSEVCTTFFWIDHSCLLASSVSLGLGAVYQERPAWIQVKVDIFANFLSTCFQ